MPLIYGQSKAGRKYPPNYKVKKVVLEANNKKPKKEEAKPLYRTEYQVHILLDILFDVKWIGSSLTYESLYDVNCDIKNMLVNARRGA